MRVARLQVSESAESVADYAVRPHEIPVYVNVYDMLPRGWMTNIGYWMGVGVFHSGVEVDGAEYNFGGHDYPNCTGVFVLKPREGPPNTTLRDSILVGYTTLAGDEIVQVVRELSREWLGNSYNLLTRNCNHFSSEMCHKLVKKRAPGWINRAAKLGTYFPCVVPNGWIDPPDCEESIPSGVASDGSPSTPGSSGYEPYIVPETQALNPRQRVIE